MDVAPAGGDVLEGAAFGADRVGDAAHGGEGREEGAGREQLALLAAVAEMLAVERVQVAHVALGRELVVCVPVVRVRCSAPLGAGTPRPAGRALRRVPQPCDSSWERSIAFAGAVSVTGAFQRSKVILPPVLPALEISIG